MDWIVGYEGFAGGSRKGIMYDKYTKAKVPRRHNNNEMTFPRIDYCHLRHIQEPSIFNPQQRQNKRRGSLGRNTH